MAFSQETKDEAMRRAGGRCECERGSHTNHFGRCNSTDRLEVHHRTAEGSGGGDSLSNAKVLCHRCHQLIPRPS